MRLSSMRYKNYTWPHNPETFVVEYRRQMAAHKIPLGGCVLQDLGVNCRILRGEGEFAGPGAYEEFKALAAVFPATTLQTCIVHLIRNSLDCKRPAIPPLRSAA